MHVAAYLTVVLLVLSPLKALAFVVVHQALFGLYMGASFAPNHKGMAMPEEHDRPDFLRGQVLTSRNVRGGRVIDFVLGGLNYQIEHHLFPSMPRIALPAAQPLVRAYCANSACLTHRRAWWTRTDRHCAISTRWEHPCEPNRGHDPGAASTHRSPELPDTPPRHPRDALSRSP